MIKIKPSMPRAASYFADSRFALCFMRLVTARGPASPGDNMPGTGIGTDPSTRSLFWINDQIQTPWFGMLRDLRQTGVPGVWRVNTRHGDPDSQLHVLRKPEQQLQPPEAIGPVSSADSAVFDLAPHSKPRQPRMREHR